MSIQNLTSSQLRRAVQIKEHIEKLQDEINQITATAKPVAVKAPKTSKFSAAGIARIRAAQKARWAKVKTSNRKAKGKPSKAKRTMSAAARAKIAAAARARWAKFRAAKKK
ncbi:MAG TPA: hypothetical protein VNX46_16245 [Candidatus Acidoferrum sp.]|jgi:hypothetical protein|nr:hypothetical protein [Candidatus Acidoferrum sp.]